MGRKFNDTINRFNSYQKVGKWGNFGGLQKKKKLSNILDFPQGLPGGYVQGIKKESYGTLFAEFTAFLFESRFGHFDRTVALLVI